MATAATKINVPAGFKLHTENQAHILLPDDNEAFLNPVQEFNRDLSVACITVWGEELNREKKRRWRERLQRNVGVTRKGKGKDRQKRVKGMTEQNLFPNSYLLQV